MTDSDRIHRLARAIERFLTPGDVLRERLCAETPHMAPETMALGLDVSLEGWDEAGIASLWSEEQAYMEGGLPPDLVAVILGGSLPPSHVQAMAYPYLLGAELIVKHPADDALFPMLFAQALGERVTLVGRLGLGGVLGRADAVIAVGDDETVRTLQAEVAVATPFLGFGHRSAVELVCGSAVARSEEVAVEIARDLTLFDQRGCLSPREILVVGDKADAATLAGHIAAACIDLPRRRPLDVAIEGALRQEREASLALGRLTLGPNDLQWGVRVEEGGTWTGTPGGRHVVIRTIDRLSSVPEVLAPLAGHLSAVGVAGDDPDPPTRAALMRLGASRIVPVGRLQSAPPTWPHDGRRPLAALCRWCGSD